jgi:SAM-dependent methyltransferase
MPEVNCNLCGADDFAEVFPAEPERGRSHRIVCCRKCSLMYANPQLVVDCVRFEGEQRPFDPEGADRQYFQKQLTQMPDYERVVGVLNSFCPQRGRLLEVGSYLGLLLDRFRATGWDTTGLEPDRPVATWSRARFGLHLLEQTLPCPELADGKFDAAVMLHVIEHVPDPGSVVRELRRLVRPGGMLVVETPRFDSLLFHLLGRRERSINNCPGHIYFFTVPTLRRLLEQNGFAVERVDLVGRTLTVERLIYNVGLVSRHAGLQRLLGRLALALRLDRARLHLNFRDMQRMYCRAK